MSSLRTVILDARRSSLSPSPWPGPLPITAGARPASLGGSDPSDHPGAACHSSLSSASLTARGPFKTELGHLWAPTGERRTDGQASTAPVSTAASNEAVPTVTPVTDVTRHAQVPSPVARVSWRRGTCQLLDCALTHFGPADPHRPARPRPAATAPASGHTCSCFGAGGAIRWASRAPPGPRRLQTVQQSRGYRPVSSLHKHRLLVCLFRGSPKTSVRIRLLTEEGRGTACVSLSESVFAEILFFHHCFQVSLYTSFLLSCF